MTAITPIYEPPKEQEKTIAEGLQKEVQKTSSALKGAVPIIVDLSKEQRNTAYALTKIVKKLPGIETRPEITNVLNLTIKSEGKNILTAKALVDKKEQIFSVEIEVTNVKKEPKTVILTISINDGDKSTAILLSDKNGKIIEGFYNKPKQA